MRVARPLFGVQRQPGPWREHEDWLSRYRFTTDAAMPRRLLQLLHPPSRSRLPRTVSGDTLTASLEPRSARNRVEAAAHLRSLPGDPLSASNTILYQRCFPTSCRLFTYFDVLNGTRVPRISFRSFRNPSRGRFELASVSSRLVPIARRGTHRYCCRGLSNLTGSVRKLSSGVEQRSSRRGKI